MKAILIAVALCAAIAVPAAAEHGHGKAKGKGPEVIQLPTNFAPEGIATAKRHTFFVGSRDTGAIYKCPEKTPPAPGKNCDSVEGHTTIGTGPLPEPTPVK